uniref:CRACD like n=1 Tax=Leptobrachium leishanense TaxID=445787 RepID=A0A8C5P6Q1_9ANUR
MDSKVRESETLVEDVSAKKKFNFKSFKKFFGIKKRKETLPDVEDNVGLKQSQSASDVTIPVCADLDYDSEDEIGATAAVLGSRAVSHDSIFIPEKVQETDRPGRVFSQENVSDRIRALQAKLQSNIKIGPPPFGIFTKRTDDAGASSEDDGLPQSPPELSLAHDTVKTRISSGHSSRPLSPEARQLTNARRVSPQRTDDDSISPSADFDSPAQFSTVLDNSAARHRLSVKPRNQRMSKTRRSSGVLQNETLEDLTSTIEEHECDNEGEAITTPTNVNENYKCMDIAQNATNNASSAQQADMANQMPQNMDVKQNEIIMEKEPQILGAQALLTSDNEELCSKVPSHREDIKAQLNMKVVNAEMEKDLVGSSPSKSNGGTPRRLSAAGNNMSELVLNKSMSPKHDQSPKSSSDKAKKLTKELTQGLVKKSSPVVQELVLTRTENEQRLQTTNYVQSHTQASQPSTNVDPSLSQNEKSRGNQELSDKENNKFVGNADKKVDKPSSEIGAQKKFSVSSASERPKGGSFSLKGKTESEVAKNLKFSVSKSAIPSSEKEKDDPKPHSTHTERKTSVKKKESFAQSKSVSVDKSSLGSDAPEQNSVPDTSGSSVITESQASSDEKNPFFVKLRSTSMSVRYREGMAQEPHRVKRHSAEIRYDKTGQMTLCNDDCTENPGPEISSKNENTNIKTNLSEQTNLRPMLAKKPVLQNITVADNNINKDTLACAPQQEKNVKSSEVKTEINVSGRRLSFQKNIGSVPENAKGTESKGQPTWVSVALQKSKSFKEERGLTGNKSAVPEANKETVDKDRIEDVLKNQGDLPQNKTANVTATVFPELHGQEIKTDVRAQRPRSNTLSHPIPVPAHPSEKEDKNPPKRTTQSVSEEPSWMELAKKKSQAWNDMPQIIK